MRWPYSRFFRSLLARVIITIIVASLFGSPLLDFSPRSVRANSPAYPAAIIDFAFQPHRVNVTTGTEVIWRNNGNTQHTVTSSPQTNTTQGGAPLISSGPLNPGQNFSYIFYKHGFYPIQCAFHPATMNGLVNVTGSDVQPPPANTTPPFDYTPYVIGGVVAGVIVVASIALFVRRRSKK
jgi:plastocyanin